MSKAPLRVACVGALGRMGERVRAALVQSSDAVLCAALEAEGHAATGDTLDGILVCVGPQ